MDAKYLQEIKARADAATLGPWDEYENGNRQQVVYSTAPTENPSYEIARIPNKSDAAFIARARTDIPALVAEVERQRKRLQQSPYGDDKIDELEESCNNLRFRIEQKGRRIITLEKALFLACTEIARRKSSHTTKIAEESRDIMTAILKQAQEQEENK